MPKLSAILNFVCAGSVYYARQVGRRSGKENEATPFARPAEQSWKGEK